MKRIVIVAARRTPFGRFRGALAELSPVQLAVTAGNAALTGVDRSLIDQVILGNVLSAGHGMNIARQVAVNLGLRLEIAATTVNMMCGSGMQSGLMAVSAIRAGEARAILVGGTESMSQSSLLAARPPKGQQPVPANFIDSMQRDGLVDSFTQRHMGEQAEELASSYGITRQQQDAFATRSQHLFGAALARGEFADELVAAAPLAMDQHPRPNISQMELAALPTVFSATTGNATVTAGNASGVNDGAAVLLLAERDFAVSHGWPMLAEWIDGIVVGCDPDRMGLGPVHAIRSLMARRGIDWKCIDTLEINEAFAAQVLACLKELHLTLPDENGPSVVATSGHQIGFNRAGGAIAIGHPLAASGARLLTHLAWDISRGRSRSAIGSLCIGGGMGIAALMRAME